MILRSSPFYSPTKKSDTSNDGAVTLDLSGDNIDAFIESESLPFKIQRRQKPPDT